MARKIIAVAFIVISLAICFIGQSLINSTVSPLLKEVLIIEEMVNSGEIDKAINEAEVFLEEWDKAEKILSVLITHSEIDNVNLTLEQAISYLFSKEKVDFFAQSAELKKLLKHLIENEKVNIQNIF